MSAKVDREKRTHCLGCSGWFSNGVHDEGYECPGDAVPPADPLAGLTVEPVEVVSWNRPTTSREEYVGLLDAAAKVEWHSNHEAELPVGPILAALRGRTLRGLWVQVVGDEFRVSVQYDFAGAVDAKDGHGPTVREASKVLLAALRATSSEGQER